MKAISVLAVAAVLVACVSAQEARFKNKVVLVTGGTSGIGYATALGFAREGAKVIIVARDSNVEHYSGEKAVNKISNDDKVKTNGGSVRFFKADMAEKDDANALFKNITAVEGRLDIGVNSAGVSGPMGTITDTMKYNKKKEYCPIRNNIYTAIRACAGEEKIMCDQNISGVIINVAAIEGVTPAPYLPRYGASKYAIIGLTNSIALGHISGDPAPYIRCNSVAPGPVATPFLFNRAKWFAKGQQPWEGEFISNESHPIWKESEGNFTEDVPMARIAKPAEVANTILWLCSDEASHISGDTIMVDGGLWSA